MRYKVFCGFLIIALGNTGYAGVKEGVKAFESRLDSIAAQELLPLAVKGDAEAQYYIGMMYWAGREFTKNYGQASIWFSKSANQNYAPSYVMLYRFYDIGYGVEKNKKVANEYKQKAIDLYQSAIKKGDTNAMIALGNLLEGVDAGTYYIKAAEKGSIEGQFKAGFWLARNDYKTDYTQALKWLNMAANSNHPEAYYQLARIYDEGVGVQRNRAKAIEFYRKAADLGFVGITKEAAYKLK